MFVTIVSNFGIFSRELFKHRFEGVYRSPKDCDNFFVKHLNYCLLVKPENAPFDVRKFKIHRNYITYYIFPVSHSKVAKNALPLKSLKSLK